MKLTPAQQRVVDDMRRGWELRYMHNAYTHISNPEEGSRTRRTVAGPTLDILIKAGALESWRDDTAYCTVYTLAPEWREKNP